ncbi:MAG: protein-S-isoprenylcysteine methyltransferase [Rhodospirillaceae bacterium]|nr:protein-S-isoprenylcysteine methyltransferase [Rhodospirillaceae bacterium]|tara:strand:- start:1209 stop:1691 length:483 start_codon:yes stop_codon:yes gene_type:complete
MNEDTKPVEADSPNVITFPPVIYGTFFIIGIITDRALSHSLDFHGYRHPVGWVLVAVGAFIVCWALAQFIKSKTHVDVRKPATTLVTDGPYRFSRNPMYLAASLLYAGIAIAFGKVATLACLLPCVFVLHYGVIKREEHYLEEKFGDEYTQFRARIRRWL